MFLHFLPRSSILNILVLSLLEPLLPVILTDYWQLLSNHISRLLKRIKFRRLWRLFSSLLLVAQRCSLSGSDLAQRKKRLIPATECFYKVTSSLRHLPLLDVSPMDIRNPSPLQTALGHGSPYWKVSHSASNPVRPRQSIHLRRKIAVPSSLSASKLFPEKCYCIFILQSTDVCAHASLTQLYL